MLGHERLAMFDDMHELRNPPSRRATTSCRGDGDGAGRGIVHTGHAKRVASAGSCHARCAQCPAMITRLLVLALLCGATLAGGAQGPMALVAAPGAADWEALACTALVALYVARRRSHWRSG